LLQSRKRQKFNELTESKVKKGDEDAQGGLEWGPVDQVVKTKEVQVGGGDKPVIWGDRKVTRPGYCLWLRSLDGVDKNLEQSNSCAIFFGGSFLE